MARGHSAEPGNITALRALMEGETPHGQTKLAGIALSYATGLAEKPARDVARRIIVLRFQGVADPSILIRLNPLTYRDTP